MPDVRSALKALTAARGFTTLAVLTLGIGLALCVTVLTVVNAYMVRALPYPASDRLFRVDYAAPNQSPLRGLNQLDWESLDDVIEFPVAWDLDVFYILGNEYPESMPGGWVTPGYLQALGVRAARGRVFTPDDYRPGSAPVALISHRLWQTRFGGDEAVVGRQFQAYVSDRPNEAESFTIVGVLPQDMWHMNPYTEVLAPLRVASYPYMVRLRSGVSALLATERMTQLIRGRISTLPADFRVVLTPAQQAYIAAIRPILWAVSAAAGLVLLIAGANVAVLMLVRARRRQKELAIRLALGAGQLRVARLLVIEALVIGGLATVIGTISSGVAMSSLAPAIERVLERRVPGGLDAFAMDYRVLLAACASGLLVTLVFALAPVIATWRSSIAPNLSLSGRAMTDNTSASRSRAVLIGVEVAASLTLLVGAALMAETAMRMLRVDFGIRPDNVMTASLALRQRSFPDPASRMAFYDRLLARLGSLPGGSSVALGDWWPLQGSRPRRVETMGDTPVTGGANPFAVTSAYFDALGMSIRDGRAFTPADRLGSEPVAIISQSLAERLWPQTRAIGQRFTIHPDGAEEVLATPVVVGVVNDVRQSHSDTDLYDVYLPLAQRAGRFAFLYLQGTQSPTWETELRSAIASVDSGVAVGAPQSLAFGLEQERARPRFLALLLTAFAVFATVLALVGMHGAIAYAVRQRQREIAVRIAIGADAGSVIRMFLRNGLVVLVAGIATGILGAIGLSQILQSQLHGVRPAEPRTLALAALTFAVCGLLAIWWPAWRAASTDPVLVLKEE